MTWYTDRMIRKWDIADDKVKKQCLDEIITRMHEEDDTEIGVIAAQEIIDIVARYVGPHAYNLAVDDCKRLLQTKLADLEIDLDISKASI